MNREIKFRAWVKQSKTLLTWNKLLSLKQYAQDIEIDYPLSGLEDTELEWMQFTGLKDQQGVEIYEGDIVTGGMLRAQDGYSVVNDKSIVTFENGMFKAGSISLCTINRSCKVIGNIYQDEHPNLLK